MPITDTIIGSLKLVGSPDKICPMTWDELLRSIPSLYAVDVPRNVTNVTIGAVQPPESDNDNLWVRINSDGTFVGFYTFQTGAWRKAYQYTLNDVIWRWGNSASIEDGFKLIDQNSALPVPVIDKLMLDYVVDPVNPTNYIYFAVQFVGYGAI
jgi:hypothetical protein